MDMIREKRISSKTLRLIKDNITGRDVVAIVNAANSYLKHVCGVAQRR